MSTQSATSASRVSPELRARLREQSLVPLWESDHALKEGDEGPQTHLWSWAAARPVIMDVGRVAQPEVVSRRILTLVDPQAGSEDHQSTTGVLSTCLQLLMPGEHAFPHRHSMNALRFVLEGSGAVTIVDGKRCPMEFGDLILTPSWTWHEHVNDGGTPTIWLDALDVGLHLALGTNAFEPGPVSGDAARQYDDELFATPNVLPDVDVAGREASPVFRYPYAEAGPAVARAPLARDGARRIRYVNPATGGSCLGALDCTLMQLDPGMTTVPFTSTASAVATVVEGSGRSTIGDRTVTWEAHDVFSLPQGKAVVHTSGEGGRLFVVSNRDTYRRLGLLEETYA